MNKENQQSALDAKNSPATSEFIRSTGSHLYGKCVEYGDDSQGAPRMVISTTREEIEKMKENPLYRTVRVQTRGDGAEKCMDVARLIMRGFGVKDREGFQEEIAYILKREFIF